MASWKKVGLGTVLIAGIVGFCAGGSRGCVLCQIAKGIAGVKAEPGATPFAGGSAVGAAGGAEELGELGVGLRFTLRSFGDPGEQGGAYGGVAPRERAPRLLAVLGLNRGVESAWRLPGETDEELGGGALYLSPGLQLAVSRRWLLEVSYEALHVDLGGKQPGDAGRAVFGGAFRF